MTKTINGLTESSSAASGDFLAIWRAANGDTRKITKANFMGGVLSGGGTIVTGGHTLTVGGTSAINGTLSGAGTIATGGFTGTLPATGTLALLGGTQTFSGEKDFTGGIKIGSNEAITIYDEISWTPVITGGSGNPTITYTTQNGQAWRFNKLIIYHAYILINTVSGGGGSLRLSLPVTVGAQPYYNGLPHFAGLDADSDVLWNVFLPSTGQTYGQFLDVRDDTTADTVLVTTLAAGDIVTANGFYLAA